MSNGKQQHGQSVNASESMTRLKKWKLVHTWISIVCWQIRQWMVPLGLLPVILHVSTHARAAQSLFLQLRLITVTYTCVITKHDDRSAKNKVTREDALYFWSTLFFFKLLLFSKLPFHVKSWSISWSSFHTVSQEPYNDVFENPSGFITKCYSSERGRNRDRDWKQKCVFLSAHRGVCVCVVSAWGWVFVIVHMTPTQNAREKLSETDR